MNVSRPSGLKARVFPGEVVEKFPGGQEIRPRGLKPGLIEGLNAALKRRSSTLLEAFRLLDAFRFTSGVHVTGGSRYWSRSRY